MACHAVRSKVAVNVCRRPAGFFQPVHKVLLKLLACFFYLFFKIFSKLFCVKLCLFNFFKVPFDVKLFVLLFIFADVFSCSVRPYSKFIEQVKVPEHTRKMQSLFPRFNFLAVKIALAVVAKAPDVAHIRLAVLQPEKITAGDPPPFILKLALYGIAEKLDRPRVNVIGYDALVIFVGNGKVCHCAATGKEVVEVFCRGENFKNLCGKL